MRSSPPIPRRWTRVFLAAFLAVLAGAAEGRAQVPTGNLYGTVTDEQGSPLPGVTVTLTGADGGPSVHVTNAQGQFRFLNLSPGERAVKADLEGFGTIDYPNVGIAAGRSTTLEVTLSAAVGEEITVTSESPLLDPQRDPWVILQSTPGVLVDRINVGGNESGQQSQFTGSGFAVDGVIVTDMAAAGSPPSYYNFESFEEMQAGTGETDASIATGGVVLNLITRHGKNEFQGAARSYITGEPRADDKPPAEGAAIGQLILDILEAEDGKFCFQGNPPPGGPLPRDRIWFFPAGGGPGVRSDLFADVPVYVDGVAVGRIPACPGSDLDLVFVDGHSGQPIRDEFGDPVIDPTTGYPMTAVPPPTGGFVFGDPSRVASALTDPLRDGPSEREYEAVSLTFNKRFTNNWQLYGSAVWADRPDDVPAGLEFNQGSTPAGDPCLDVGVSGPDGPLPPDFLQGGSGFLQFNPVFFDRSLDLSRNPFCDPAMPIQYVSSFPVATHAVLGEGIGGFDMDLAAYNAGGTWAPVRDIRFRSSYYKAVRAPSIQELFGGTTVPPDGGLFVMAVDLPPSAGGATGGGSPWFDLDGDGQRDLTFLSGADFQNPCDGVYYGAFTVQRGEGGGYLEPDPNAPPLDCDSVFLQDRVRLGDYFSLNLGVRADAYEEPREGARIIDPSNFFNTGDLSHELKFGGSYRTGREGAGVTRDGVGFVNDRWRLNDQWSFNLGNRYDETPGTEDPAGGFGGQLGGPIVKDRLWIWGSYGQPGTEEEPGGDPPLADAFGDGMRVGYDGTLESYLDPVGFNPAFLNVGRYLMGQNYGARLRIQSPGGARGPGGSILDLADAEPLLLFESLGGSTGEVVRAHLLHDGAGPVSAEGFAVLEPVETTSALRERFDQAIQGAAAKATATIEAYCLDKVKIPLSQGELFRLAPRAVQEAYAHVGGILDAAERLKDAGLLSPDTDPESYFHSIRQWSIWAREEGYDRAGFLEAFVEHTQKNVEDGGQRWTDEIEEIVRRSAGGRWQDVEKVLEAAGTP